MMEQSCSNRGLAVRCILFFVSGTVTKTEHLLCMEKETEEGQVLPRASLVSGPPNQRLEKKSRWADIGILPIEI